MAGRAGASGRRPNPTSLKILNGNPGRRPLNKDEPKPRAKLPACPAHLTPAAKREWQRIGQKLLTLGLVTEMDRAALAAYCQVYARWVEAEEQIQKHGTVWKLTTKAGTPWVQQSPYLQVANKALEQMMRYLVEFGMSPASRSRVHALPLIDEDNPAEEFFLELDRLRKPVNPW